ncbi:alpha/beta hydrolase [Mesorhizobium sp.]|uniref:alpha/beta hydrolase n=1 Tax=Mesorhizobium sp. TaxID=1871066 RepID=UPI0025D889B9|nr:alpha/beta hydrolase [Mesorhizobium sp.]
MSLTAYHVLTSPPAEGAPLIFAFHGTGGNEHQFFDLAQGLVGGAGVVSPRGDVSEAGAARFFRRTAEGVYDMDDLAQRTDRMATFVAAHSAAHSASPVYGFGYSNGANILASLMMTHPDLFDRIGLLHPLIPWTPEPLTLAGRRTFGIIFRMTSAQEHKPLRAAAAPAQPAPQEFTTVSHGGRRTGEGVPCLLEYTGLIASGPFSNSRMRLASRPFRSERRPLRSSVSTNLCRLRSSGT